MVLLAVTAETWIVTGLGFGIVLALLFCLVFIIQFLGWCMQKMLAPKAPKTVKEETKPATPAPAPKPAVASVSEAGDVEKAAIAMALYLFSGGKHDLPTAPIAPQARNTAWNAKEIGLNNKGF